MSELDLRERARETYRQSVAAEMPLTGVRLGEMFDRSDRWGRGRIAEVKSALAATERAASVPISGTVSGNQQVTERHNQQVPAQASDRAERVAERPASVPISGSAVPISGSAVPISGTVSGNQQVSDAAEIAEFERDVQQSEPERLAASPAVRRTTVVAVVLVAIVAAVMSYSHMQHLAERAGEGWRSWLLPLAVDGLMVAASMTMLVRHRQGRNAGALAWVSLLAGIAASLAANVAAAEPTLIGRLVAAWPPLALLLAYELLMRQIRDTRSQ
jgi:hypothetical protein